MKIVALLDSMWGWGGYNEAGEEAPRYFRINPDNHSGRRLYWLCGDHSLLVTNSCRTVQAHANSHGTPDPGWVRSNLEFLKSERMNLLLVCGRVAQATFKQTGFEFHSIMWIDHPAARRWTKARLNEVQRQIAQMGAAWE